MAWCDALQQSPKCIRSITRVLGGLSASRNVEDQGGIDVTYPLISQDCFTLLRR